MACPRFLPWFDQSSKISVLPAPVGAWTTTSLPSRRALTACCCQRSGTATWLRAGSSASGEEKVDTAGLAQMSWISYMSWIGVNQINGAGVGNCESHVVMGTRYPSLANPIWEIGKRYWGLRNWEQGRGAGLRGRCWGLARVCRFHSLVGHLPPIVLTCGEMNLSGGLDLSVI